MRDQGWEIRDLRFEREMGPAMVCRQGLGAGSLEKEQCAQVGADGPRVSWYRYNMISDTFSGGGYERAGEVKGEKVGR